MAIKRKPEFLHVPELYEESTAIISWENMPETDRYDLDIVFNEDFDQAGKGKSWADLDLEGWAWADQTEDTGLTWQDMRELPAQGLMWRNIEFHGRTWEEWAAVEEKNWQWMQKHPMVYTVYHGPGEDVPAPDQGLTWSNMAMRDWSWETQDQNTLSWRDISLIPSVGLTWGQHDANDLAWEEAGVAYDSWYELEHLPPRGLTWGGLQARWLTWDEMKHCSGDGLSWHDLNHLPPDIETQKGVETDIPLYTKRSMMRVRAFDEQNSPGEHLTTALMKHRPRSLAAYQVPCLHIPALYEGETAQIVWGELYGAQTYIVERRLSGGSYTVVYHGPGTTVPHPTGCNGPMEHWYGPDCKQHPAFTDRIPYYEKTAQYRIRGCNTTDTSQILELPAVEIIPVFVRNDSLTVKAVAGERFPVQIQASEIERFANLTVTMEYDCAVLELADTHAQNAYGIATGAAKDLQISLLSNEKGRLKFTCKKTSGHTLKSTGLITLCTMKGLKTSNTVVRMY